MSVDRVRSRSPVALMALAAGLLLASGCVSGSGPGQATPAPQEQNATGRPRVLTTTTQIRDLVTNVGGDRITVLPILEAGQDAHVFQPDAADARAFAAADVIFANGIGLEPWLEGLSHSARPGVRIVKLGEESGIPLRPGDPHVWFDATHAIRMVGKILATLQTADPAGAAAYELNAARYVEQLEQLDLEIMGAWAAVPGDQPKLVTNHEAFGYYVDAYGLDFVGSVIPRVSTEAEPSPSEAQQLVDRIRAEGARAIFTESSVSPRLAEQIGNQAGVRIVSKLYADSLGESGSDADTYLKMMRFNTRTMIAALTG